MHAVVSTSRPEDHISRKAIETGRSGRKTASPLALRALKVALDEKGLDPVVKTTGHGVTGGCGQIVKVVLKYTGLWIS